MTAKDAATLAATGATSVATIDNVRAAKVAATLAAKDATCVATIDNVRAALCTPKKGGDWRRNIGGHWRCNLATIDNVRAAKDAPQWASMGVATEAFALICCEQSLKEGEPNAPVHMRELNCSYHSWFWLICFLIELKSQKLILQNFILLNLIF